MVAASVGSMPLMIGEGLLETREARVGRREPGEAEAGGRDPAGCEECACHACQAASRDEMWVRWA